MQRMTIPFGEIKMSPVDGEMKFSGHGAAFNNIDSYGDVIAPGAFAQFLSDVELGKQPWPAMLSQHGAMGLTSEDLTPIGVYTSLAEDGKGLAVAGDFAPTQRGKEMHSLMSMKPRPAVDGLSIGYIAKKFDPRTAPDEPRRTLREIVLIEVSPVTFPANRNARVTDVKSFLSEVETLSEIEAFLRDVAGLSRNEAKALISSIKSAGRVDASDELAQITTLIKRNTNNIGN
jgi:HK97 family phage prohead protease